MSNPSPAKVPNRRPVDLVIADALAELDGIEERDLPEVIELLTASSEVLSKVLETSAEGVQVSLPTMRQP